MSDDPIDFTPLYGPPDPARLERLAGRISASVAARRRRSLVEQLLAWAPWAIGVAALLAALAWVPALTMSTPRRTPGPEVVLLQRALSGGGSPSHRRLWFSP